MASKTGKCYTPTSLWCELNKLITGTYNISIKKRNQYETDYVIINK